MTELEKSMVWMSYRYCIGRKTIAACSHAADIARYSFNDISMDRRVFMANDIRGEINNVLKWRNNITYRGCHLDGSIDVLSSIIYRLLDKYGEELPSTDIWEKYKFEVHGDEVVIFENTESVSHTESIPFMFQDLLPWIKLANALDHTKHKVVSTVYDGVKKDFTCFSYPYMDYSGKVIGKKWVDLESYLNNPSIDRYIDEQYITEIK